jgi:hypothetical protein
MEAAGRPLYSPRQDYGACALAMILCALALTLANNVDLYDHLSFAVCCLSLAIASCAAASFLPSLRKLNIAPRRLAVVIGLIIALQAILTQAASSAGASMSVSVAAIAGTGVLHLWRPFRHSAIALAILATAFLIMGYIAIHQPSNGWTDVLVAQQKACGFLLRGVNPYAAKYPNIYTPNTPLYAPGLVDANNNLKYGFGYPPLSLLMVLPSYLITGDVRYALAAALALSAVFMAFAGGNRLGIPAAAALLTAPQWSRMLTMGWIEPLLILNFSLVMFCACRWRRGLPYALGLFLATKQYAIVILPILPLLMQPQPCLQKLPQAILKTAAVLAILNLPFFLWNPSAFMHSLVTAQYLQSFRPDALSYSAWIYRHSDGWIMPMWAALLAVFIACIQALRRGVRSPAGFAAAATLVLLVFFAFNKQAFCNYYYFLMASAWWSVVAAKLPQAELAADEILCRQLWKISID